VVARAPLVEVFHSVQGEGRFAGVPMAFLRVATCPLRCSYCDTPNSYTAPPRVPVRAGQSETSEPNPVDAARAAALVASVVAGAGTAGRAPRVSITGGEPLVFPDFVRELGERVRSAGMRVHLETAAIHPQALAACVAQVDHLSADYKLPETLSQGQRFGCEHVACCELAVRRGATVDVKIVLTPSVGEASLARALTDLAPLRGDILLVLQPVTPFGAETRRLEAKDLERHLAHAVRAGFDVRVLPQVHKSLGLA
jgi:organic radical activating enzyme